MKIKLYLDFDGVILDTINTTYKHLEQLNITEEEKKQEYYRTVDWHKLIHETDQIDNSIDKIKKIIESNLYDVAVLTHVNSELEGIIKIDYLADEIPGLKVIPVPKKIDKCDAVNPQNAVLVDDFLDNLELWYKKGGIPIKFSDNGKECKYSSISSLDEVISMYNDIKTKVKKRTKTG